MSPRQPWIDSFESDTLSIKESALINHVIRRRGVRDGESNSIDNNPPPVRISGRKATIEVFVVADQHMVAFHGNETLQNYILTMMNMVSIGGGVCLDF